MHPNQPQPLHHVNTDRNEDDRYTAATATVQHQQHHQPLLQSARISSSSSNHLRTSTKNPPQYGSCCIEEYETPHENDIMILQSDSENDDDTSLPPPPPKAISSSLSLPLFVVGSVPHSVLVATTIGIACGISAYIYNSILQYGLITIWKTWSQQILVLLLQKSHDDTTTDFGTASLPTWTVLWIPLVAIVLSIGLGYTVRYVGEPGDLASTIQCVHSHGWIELNHALPMALASLFSIIAGASVGPEAALVAICATLAGFISQSIFGINPKTQRNLVRKHTLMGVCPTDKNVSIVD
jgi:hypothetical protein